MCLKPLSLVQSCIVVLPDTRPIRLCDALNVLHDLAVVSVELNWPLSVPACRDHPTNDRKGAIV
jgi:hypothetical protein